MIRLTLTAVLLIPSFAVAGDLERLQGRWSLVSRTRNGAAETEEQIKRQAVEWLVDDNKLYSYRGDKEHARGVLGLDDLKNPKWIDLKLTRPNGQTEVGGGIYELKGTTLKMCITAGGNPRPKDFKAESGSLNVIMVFKKKGTN